MLSRGSSIIRVKWRNIGPTDGACAAARPGAVSTATKRSVRTGARFSSRKKSA
jgi:hypothetical protein